MSEYEVPREMQQFVIDRCGKGWVHPEFAAWTEEVLLMAIRWISENPQVPTEEQLQSIADEHKRGKCYPEKINLYIEGFQRRMFRKPEPEVPEEVTDLLWDSKPSTYNAMPDATHNRQILEAYRRGKAER